MAYSSSQGDFPSRFPPLAEHLASGIALLDSELHLQYLNPALKNLLGIDSSGLVNQPLAVIDPQGSRLIEFAQRALTSTSSIRVRDYSLGVRQASELQVDLSFTPLFDTDCALLLEVHPLVRVADGADAPKLSETLRGLAHEVKNPLAGVRGAAQLLRRRVTEPELQELADIILQEADRLATLTDRLLHAGGKPHLSAINIHETAERVRTLAMVEVGAGLKIECDYDPSLPGLHGDADRLQQLLLNLMRNAIEANAKHIVMRTRAERSVLIGERTLRLALRLELIDDGHGVPDELSQSLFLPLVSGRSNGTGLGLPLAQEIAREHGGALSYRSRPGHTVFTLLLPLGNHHG